MVSCVPQRYPSCAGDGRGRSRRYGGGSCAGGKATRTCRSGNGRSCCRHGRTAYPNGFKENMSALLVTVGLYIHPFSCCSCWSFMTPLNRNCHWRRGDEIRQFPSLAIAKSVAPPNPRPRPFPHGFRSRSHFPAGNHFGRAKNAYLSRVDPLAGEGIVVRSHCGGLLSRLSVVGRCFLEGAMFQRRFSSISFRSEVVR